MGRKKQRPHRSGGLLIESQSGEGTNLELGKENASANRKSGKDASDTIDKPYFVNVERSSWALDEHFDISELALTDISTERGFPGFEVVDIYQNSTYSFRFRVSNVNEFVARIKLGHWPVLSAKDIQLEMVEECLVETTNNQKPVLSGYFDGPDEGVSGLVHLVSLKFMSIRPLEDIAFSKEMSTLRVRVEILKGAFEACESLLDNTRQLWKKSMMSVMAWLRPEVLTSEARYGIFQSKEIEVSSPRDVRDSAVVSQEYTKFDVGGFYEAIKPSKEDSMLDDDIPYLLPKLRPYQRRAAFWMIQREKGTCRILGNQGASQLVSPLCMTVGFVDSSLKLFYNPFSGNLSVQPEPFSTHVSGGILADEMGLGKTVELLACILAHRWSESESSACIDEELQPRKDLQPHIKRLKKERVECICGAVSESYRYEGLWVQCDLCDAWQHSDCVGYSPRGKRLKNSSEQQQREKKMLNEKSRRRKQAPTVVEREGRYICQSCSELISATDSPVASGATLIVCPAPILHQWQAEIIRHTSPGSVKMLVYEGVRNTTFSGEPAKEVDELVGYDIVLTTYDVLKEDLSHDSDRHDGDRRFLRYQKRYPVIPTPLTRIFWWRLCLDEAQMVENNAAAATEMALRLHSKHRWCITGTPIQRKLDDLYGLLKFLKLSPFNVSRWWSDVIRDPYESRDAGAMEFTHRLFKQIMWRSSKKHIADELDLPPQEECLSWLSFSAIEEHFYQRQHETCADYARELIENLKADIIRREVPGSASSSPFDCLITHVEAAKLLSSLLKLRQACCHPQVGSSGLRSLQQSPMTMEEVLMVLISKTKIEGEEALRRLVVALNGLAAIAIIEGNPSQAISLYKEAMDLAKEHSEDFSLDPLLNIHIHHNLSEVLFKISDPPELQSADGLSSRNSEAKVCKRPNFEDYGDQYAIKRQKLNGTEDGFAACTLKADVSTSDASLNALNQRRESSAGSSSASDSFSYGSLKAACENFKQKYLSPFNSKLTIAQLEFKKSYEQVCNALADVKNRHSVWWLDVLHHIEQNGDSSNELIRKIKEAVLGSTNNSRSSRIASSFRSVHGLKYYIQTGLDSLEASRTVVLDRLLQIDQTIDNPRDEDIERVGHCQNCQLNGNGPVCSLCELDELFQIYEARLFRLSDARGGRIITAEEALDIQKKKSALNQFYRTLSQANKNSSFKTLDEDIMGKRDTGENVMVSKSPSELELVLGVIRGFSKTHLGNEGKTAASTQLRLLEDMRKEYAVARSLCIAQAQVLRAHDEIKMSTSRLRLREDDNDKSLNALIFEELPSTNVFNSNEKFISLALLSRIKGKLRYLKGLVQAKHKSSMASSDSSVTQETPASFTTPLERKNDHSVNADQEACPVCQEKLGIQKMVFQCGHVTCCKCLFALTEHKQGQAGEVQRKWVMCPTCRQHTDFANIAYADDRLEKSSDSAGLHEFQDSTNEASVSVQGSYGTKIEAVARRILWIKSTDPKSKVLVFSSWNDVLDVLEHAFKANGICYARMKGGRKAHTAISHFRGQKDDLKVSAKEHSQDIQVLMLLVQHGANGLNLLEAQHVVLVEPLLNPAVEAQAISRVHRIGQEKRTLVHRFIVRNSVEESIYKLNRSRNSSLFISGNTKNQDQPVLTLKDVESLFAVSPATPVETDKKPAESLTHLPPSVAAAIAAERRLKEQIASHAP